MTTAGKPAEGNAATGQPSQENLPVEHQNVPAAHQGLHSFLYSAEDEHRVATPTARLDDDGTSEVAVDVWQDRARQGKVAGVYAVLDRDLHTQYIGYSRDVGRSLEGHITQNSSEACAFIRVKTFKFPKRQAMEDLQNEWMAALDYTPPGNQGNGTWASTVGEAARATMSAAERNAYEEKKLKLRKAMADATLTHELEQPKTQDGEEAERRRKLEAAVKNDDWSAVVES